LCTATLIRFTKNTINIPEDELRALAQDSLDTESGIERLERAAASLYKAILSTRGDIAAAAELSDDYARYSGQFARRFADFLGIGFRGQVRAPRCPQSNGKALIAASTERGARQVAYLQYRSARARATRRA
jgi:hypothetical protein